MTPERVDAYIAVGANLGDAPATVRAALAALDGLPQTRLVQASSLYRTAPWQAQGPDFINAVAHVRTGLEAMALLQALHTLEDAAGRARPYVNAPRTLDLDLLLHGHTRSQTPALTVPHPRMWARAFVLVPLAEIAPALVSTQALQAVADQAIERLP